MIPVSAKKTPVVLTHGSGTTGYQTTFDGKPGFQSLYLKAGFPVYLVDLPRTGRAGLSCDKYTWDPHMELWSARFVFINRIGEWDPGQDEKTRTFWPGVAFPKDPEAWNQYSRVQYPEFIQEPDIVREAKAQAVLMEEVYRDHGTKGILFSHSSGGTRSTRTGMMTDKVGAMVSFEPLCMSFPEGEEPKPAVQADGSVFPYTCGTVPLAEFKKLTKMPILLVWGDFIPWKMDPKNVGPRLFLDTRRIMRERWIAWVDAVNRHGGNAKNLFLPEVGVTGNTHYPYADTNAEQVAAAINRWIREQKLDN